MFQPETEYDIGDDIIPIRDFHEYPELFVVRPPYQRKNVWNKKKQQDLLDSLFRGYYVPKLVLREVRLSRDEVVREVVDGQQRIVTVQRFFDGELRLPRSLESLDPKLGGKLYGELASEHRMFADKQLKYKVDLIKGIDQPDDPRHQTIATEIFWRLQQGESLNYMEIAHARLSSLARNFIVKYADDISFDHENYRPIDANPHKHRFFDLIQRGNDRMQYLALLARLLMMTEAGGPTDIRDTSLSEWIDSKTVENGIGNFSYETTPAAREALRTLNLFTRVFEADPAVDEASGVPEFRVEYFIISTVMLLDYLRKGYAFGESYFEHFRRFAYQFFRRWKQRDEEDRDILIFSDNRQQGATEIETRERVMRQLFFAYLSQSDVELRSLDQKRAFNEAERIEIYRKQDGLCQMCLEEGLLEDEARVTWSQFQADHIEPWVRGGRTAEWNGQVLCSRHNLHKGAS